MTTARRAVLLEVLGQAYDQRAWHGPNLKTALRGVGVDAAAWRASPERHNIWELALHAAYWKYRVWRVVVAEPDQSFGIKGSNFVERPEPGAPGEARPGQWRDDLAFLDAWHQRLLAAVRAFPVRRLLEPSGQNKHTFEGLIAGAAAHDLYHAGQVRLLHRLWEDAQ